MIIHASNVQVILSQSLSQRFGAAQVFRDISIIAPGADFVAAIEAAVGACDCALVVIGPQWLTAANAAGQCRLDDPEDFVRLEVLSALQRTIPLIPLLVGGA